MPTRRHPPLRGLRTRRGAGRPFLRHALGGQIFERLFLAGSSGEADAAASSADCVGIGGGAGAISGTPVIKLSDPVGWVLVIGSPVRACVKDTVGMGGCLPAQSSRLARGAGTAVLLHRFCEGRNPGPHRNGRSTERRRRPCRRKHQASRRGRRRPGWEPEWRCCR